VLFAEVPPVDAGEGDVLPFQRREMAKVHLGDLLAPSPERRDRAFEVDGVPKAYGRREQGQAARAALLVLVGAVPELAQAVEEDGPRQSVACLALYYRPCTSER
jgi:hypothetical protein